jgi:hypothetical protein
MLRSSTDKLAPCGSEVLLPLGPDERQHVDTYGLAAGNGHRVLFGQRGALDRTKAKALSLRARSRLGLLDNNRAQRTRG